MKKSPPISSGAAMTVRSGSGSTVEVSECRSFCSSSRCSGADTAATGENAVLVAARKADVIVGPLGIVVADSLGGEISPAMANAVAQSNAKRILIPFKQCDNVIVGVSDYTLGHLIQQAIDELRKIIA